MKLKAVAGIDPGKSGSCAILGEDNSIRFIDWPKDDTYSIVFERMTNMLAQHDIELCVIERVHALPKQGVTSMFSFGQNYGAWLMLLCCMQIPHIIVTPQQWMKTLVTKKDGNDTKTRVLNVCKRLFPSAAFTGPRGGVKDGRADALMMAYYARQQTITQARVEPPRASKTGRRT